jgi:hypothetical protein
MATTINTNYQKDEMAIRKDTTYARLAGLTALGGGIIMIIGAVLYFSSGTDLWAAVDGGDMTGYLTAVGGVKAQLVASLSFWIVGVLLLGTAANAQVNLCEQRQALAQVARVCAGTAVPLAMISFIAMMSLVVKIAPDTSPAAIAIADVVGWIGARADDLATALIIGFAPLFISLAGQGDWVPNWLARWGYLAGLIGLLSLIVLYIPALAAFGFLIVPVGIGWMLVTGIVLLRRGNASETAGH